MAYTLGLSELLVPFPLATTVIVFPLLKVWIPYKSETLRLNKVWYISKTLRTKTLPLSTPLAPNFNMQNKWNQIELRRNSFLLPCPAWGVYDCVFYQPAILLYFSSPVTIIFVMSPLLSAWFELHSVESSAIWEFNQQLVTDAFQLTFVSSFGHPCQPFGKARPQLNRKD